MTTRPELRSIAMMVTTKVVVVVVVVVVVMIRVMIMIMTKENCQK